MTLRLIAPNVYLGNGSDFGDANALQAAGVELAVLFGPGDHFPHAPASIGAMAIYLTGDGSHPSFMVQGLARLLAVAHFTKVLALCDSAGGGVLGAYAATCALAQKQSISYNAAKAIVKPLVTDWGVPPVLDTQGASLWP